MPKRSSKDLNKAAFDIVQQATGIQSEMEPRMKSQLGPKMKSELGEGMPSQIEGAIKSALNNDELRKQLMREMGRRGGQKGGKARAASLSAAQRKAIAASAAKERWANQRTNRSESS